MNEQLQLLPQYLSAHLGLTLAALLAGLLVSLPLGVLVAHSQRLEHLVLGVASVIQTVPSLALLAFMVPVLAALGAQSIGYLPAFIGLSLYSILPILRNTVVGIRGLDPALIEAADSVGMTSRQKLFRVELPLALPVIIAGIRTAAVWTVGTATLSTPVGAPSLGNYIFGGLQTRNYAAVLVGCVAASLLALVLDGLIRLIEKGLNWRRPLVWAGATGVLALLLAWPIVRTLTTTGGSQPVRIGAKNFTEQYILARILAGTIRNATAKPATIIESLGSTVVFDALKAGQIDVYVDYSGTLLENIFKLQQGSLDDLRRRLPEREGIEIAATLGFENTYTLAMRRSDAERDRVSTISELLPYAGQMSFGTDYEFLQRGEWTALKQKYGIAFRELRTMDPALMYEAVRNRAVDVIGAFSTDGRIISYNLLALEDDRAAIPRYDAVVLTNAQFAHRNPKVMTALKALDSCIDASDMRSMNADVDEHGTSPAAVAARFLAQHKCVPSR